MAKSFHEMISPINPLKVWYAYFETNVPNYIAPHWHRGIELSFTIAGTIDDFIIEKQHYTTHPGQIIVVNTQRIHAIYSKFKKDGQALSIVFPFEVVAQIYPPINHQVIDVNNPESFNQAQQIAYSHLQGLLYEFSRIQARTDPYKNLQLQAIADRVLALLIMNFTVDAPQNRNLGRRKDYEIRRLQLITQFINDHYQEKLNLDDIARASSVSKEYLSRFFKKEMRITVNNYLANVRSQHARNQILNSNMTLTEIVYENGFASLRAMNRDFKKLYGITASQFKKNNK